MAGFGFITRLLALAMVLLVVLVATPSLVRAQTPDQTDLIARAEAWLNNVTTLTAGFTQYSDQGEVSQGNFTMQRPYHTRFAYDAPDHRIFITTETWLHVDETTRQQVTSYPVGQTLLKYLLTPNVRLTASEDDGITTTASRDETNGVVLIRLNKATGDDAGSLLLAFADNPFVLLGWTITDAIGRTTQIAFSDMRLGAVVSPRLFLPSDYDENQQR